MSGLGQIYQLSYIKSTSCLTQGLPTVIHQLCQLYYTRLISCPRLDLSTVLDQSHHRPMLSAVLHHAYQLS